MELNRPSHPAVTYGTYPVLASLTAVVVGITLQEQPNRNAVAALLAIVPHQHGEDRGNDASVIPLSDIVLGAVTYEPHRVPARLRLEDPATCSDSPRFHRTLSWLRSTQLSATNPSEVAA
jgi:hypothetical protein